MKLSFSRYIAIFSLSFLFTLNVFADYTKGTRTYRRIQLKNGLDVLLVSDPKAPKSAASLSVGAGSTSDPEDHKGLAHFLEHMVFLGSEKFPEPDAYTSFVENNKGRWNAYTSKEETNYIFEVNHTAFEATLDRFSSMLTTPLLSAKYLEKEKNAVDDEFRKNIPDENRRAFSVIKSTANPEHAHNRFSTGNLDTLKNVDRNVTQNFFNTYYVAPLMRLALMSSLSLDQQTVLAEKYFSEISATKTPKPTFNQTSVFKPVQTPQLILHKTYDGKDTKELTIVFELPSSNQYLAGKPLSVINYFLDFEGPGSLATTLKNQGLAFDFSIGPWTTSYASLFFISLELSDKGYANIDSVIQQVSRHLTFLRKNSIPESFYTRVKQVTNISERFAESENFFDEASGLASNMRNYSEEDLVTLGNKIYADYDASLLKSYTDRLDINKAYIYITAPDVPTNETTKFHGVEYSQAPAPAQRVKIWNNINTDGINFPKENIFIAKDFSINLKECTLKPCQVKTKKTESWYFQDSQYSKPRAQLQLNLINKGLILNAQQAVTADVLNVYLSEYISNNSSFDSLLAEAGYSYSLLVSANSSSFSITGYRDKMKLVADRLIEKMNNFDVKSDLFKRSVEQVNKAYEKNKYEKSFLLAYNTYSDLLQNDYYTKSTQELLAKVTEKDLTQLFSKAFTQGSLKTYSYGQLSRQQISEIETKYISNMNIALTSSPLPLKDFYLVPEGKSYATELSSLTPNSAWIQSYQLGKRTAENEAVARVLQTLWRNSFFEDLRSEQQLGYIVGTTTPGAGKSSITQFVMFIQSGKYSAKTLRERSEIWLQKSIAELSDIDPADFDHTKKAIITDLNKPFVNIEEGSSYYHDLIYNRNANFDYYIEVEKEINKLTPKILAAKVRTLFGNSKRSMSVYVHVKGSKGPSSSKAEKTINSVDEFHGQAEKIMAR